MSKAGEIYFIGEKDLRSQQLTEYFKVGIVKENDKNLDRDSAKRLLEHQTGNPRELYIESVFNTELVELVETLIQRKFSPLGVRGEWMLLDEKNLSIVKAATAELVKEASQINTDIETTKLLAKTKSILDPLPATVELKAWHQIYIESSIKIREAKTMNDAIKKLLAQALEDPEAAENVAAMVEVQERRGKKEFLVDEFKTVHPEIYSRFIKVKSDIKGTASFSGIKTFKTPVSEFDPEFGTIIAAFSPLIDEVLAGRRSNRDLHAFGLELKSISTEFEWAKLKSENRIKVACGDHSGIEGLFKWERTEKITEILDLDALKMAHEELVAEFTIQKDPVKAIIVDPNRGYE